MKKFFSVLLFVLIIFIVIIVLGKNFIAKTAVTTGVKAMTGLSVTMDKMDVGVINSALGITGLKIYNPEGFPDRLMLDMPEIFVDYDLPAIIAKNIHLEEVRINLNEFIVVKDREGKLNLDALKVVKESKEKPAVEEKPEEKAPAPEFRIDVLKLKVDKVIYKDYSRGPEPVVKEYAINIDKEYKDITNPAQLAGSIVLTALAKTTIGQLTDLNLGGLTEGLSDVLGDVTGLATDTAGKALETGKDIGEKAGEAAKDLLEDTTGAVGDTLKKILPFGK